MLCRVPRCKWLSACVILFDGEEFRTSIVLKCQDNQFCEKFTIRISLFKNYYFIKCITIWMTVNGHVKPNCMLLVTFDTHWMEWHWYSLSKVRYIYTFSLRTLLLTFILQCGHEQMQVLRSACKIISILIHVVGRGYSNQIGSLKYQNRKQ